MLILDTNHLSEIDLGTAKGPAIKQQLAESTFLVVSLACNRRL